MAGPDGPMAGAMPGQGAPQPGDPYAAVPQQQSYGDWQAVQQGQPDAQPPYPAADPYQPGQYDPQPYPAAAPYQADPYPADPYQAGHYDPYGYGQQQPVHDGEQPPPPPYDPGQQPQQPYDDGKSYPGSYPEPRRDGSDQQ
jgi:hypothetical protein